MHRNMKHNFTGILGAGEPVFGSMCERCCNPNPDIPIFTHLARCKVRGKVLNAVKHVKKIKYIIEWPGTGGQTRKFKAHAR